MGGLVPSRKNSTAVRIGGTLYSHAGSDKDTVVAQYQEWRPHSEHQWYGVPGEPQEMFDKRMKRLEEWILSRKEQSILLVAHWGGAIRYLSGGYQTKNC